MFLNKAKASLRDAVKNDRLSILSVQDAMPRRLDLHHISPRNAIPDDYRLRLIADSDFKCKIELHQLIAGRWDPVPLPQEEDDQKEVSKDKLVIDALINVRRSLLCCSIAFSGSHRLYQTAPAQSSKDERGTRDEIFVKFMAIDHRTGAIDENRLSLHQIGCSGTQILGFNQNQRMLLLEKHVEVSSTDELLFEPLRQYVCASHPGRLLSELSFPPPETFEDLNSRQQLVANPLSIKTAMECAGPPGTGKTKVITELVRCVLHCTDYDIIILSERNGAIDAIAEKIAKDCINGPQSKRRSVADFMQWRRLLSFGSAGMGSFSRLFLLEEKLKIHPELEEFRRLINEKRQVLSLLKKKNMLRSLSAAIETLDPSLPKGSDVYTRCSLISSGNEAGLTSPVEIIDTVSRSMNDIKQLESQLSYTEAALNNTVISNSSILGQLIPVDVDAAKNNKKAPSASLPWNQRRRESRAALVSIRTCLQSVMNSDMFSLEKAEECVLNLRRAEEAHNRALSRIKSELLKDARVMMGTIGSSHKIPVLQETSDDEPLENELSRHQINNGSGNETIVVFDEAGCIPAYELLGLSRLKRSIVALICVGDKHQLPPYSPNSMSKKRTSFSRRPYVVHEEKVDSLLDVSKLEYDGDRGGKVVLNTQYRVPRDIANVLNDRIYKGNYCTPASCSVPSRGFHFVHVAFSHGGKKYENENEVKKCVELVKRYESSGQSMMVLTPYKKQQRRLQYALQQNCLDEDRVSVLTIDQCQGREADLVFLSLTRKPTRFLNKSRFNVALSRVRHKLFLLCDQKDFQAAAKDSTWECNLLAKDLLQLAASSGGGYYDGDEYDSDDYFDAYYK